MSIRGLARRAGLSPGTLCRIENGSRRTRRSTLWKIAAAIDMETAGWQRDEWLLLAGDTVARESTRSPKQLAAARRQALRRPPGPPEPPEAEEDGVWGDEPLWTPSWLR